MPRKPNPARRHPALVRTLKVVLAFVLLFLFIKFAASMWLQFQREQIEQILSQASGMQARVHGPITINFISNPGISLSRVEIKQNDSLFLSAESVNVGFEILPLLKRNLILHAITFDKMTLNLQANANGVPQLPQLPRKQDEQTATFQLTPPNLIELHNSKIVVWTPKGKTLYQLQGLNMSLLPYFINKDEGQSGSRQLALNAHIKFHHGHYKNFDTGTTQLSLHYMAHRMTADISEADIWDGKLKGTITWADMASDPKLNVNFNFNDFDASRPITLWQREAVIQGKLNLGADLMSQGKDIQALLQNLRGTVTLRGADLQLTTTDIDELITQAIKTQKYNLTDAAAYFFIGPLGVSVTKGYNLASVSRDLKSTNIKANKIVRLLARWNIEQGIANADDVAMETAKYRLAIKGRVNLVTARFEKLNIAVLDTRGCAVIVQNLDGPIASPQVSKLNFLLNPTKPIFKIIEKSTSYILSGTSCVPFYSGQLLPPVEIKKRTPIDLDGQE